MNSHREIIELWPSCAKFAVDIGVKYTQAYAWHRRDSIPGKFWANVVRAARQSGYENVTAELLAEIAEAARRTSMKRTERNKFFQMRTSQDFLDDLDELRILMRDTTGRIDTRAEIIRMLVQAALEKNCRVHENVNSNSG